MNSGKFFYAIISAILVLSFVSLAAGLPSWFDDSRLPTPRWTFTPKPTFTIPNTNTITIPTTIPTTVPKPTPTRYEFCGDCAVGPITVWTGDYQYTVAEAKVFALQKGCPPGQYCTDMYNYWYLGTTDIEGKLWPWVTPSDTFYAESPVYSRPGEGSWHYTGTATWDPCNCRMNINLDKKVIDS